MLYLVAEKKIHSETNLQTQNWNKQLFRMRFFFKEQRNCSFSSTLGVKSGLCFPFSFPTFLSSFTRLSQRPVAVQRAHTATLIGCVRFVRRCRRAVQPPSALVFALVVVIFAF